MWVGFQYSWDYGVSGKRICGLGAWPEEGARPDRTKWTDGSGVSVRRKKNKLEKKGLGVPLLGFPASNMPKSRQEKMDSSGVSARMKKQAARNAWVFPGK